jgi:hypothetical protein
MPEHEIPALYDIENVYLPRFPANIRRATRSRIMLVYQEHYESGSSRGPRPFSAVGDAQKID